MKSVDDMKADMVNAEEAADISQEEQSPSELTKVTPKLRLQSAGHTLEIQDRLHHFLP